MADPVTMTMAAGTALQVGGQVHQAKAQSAQQQFQADMTRMNADIARQQGREEQRRFRREARRERGAQRTAVAASGLQQAGSAMDIMADTAFEMERDALQIRHQTERQVTGIEAQARQQDIAADVTRRAGRLGAGTALLRGGTQIAEAQ